MVYAWQTDLAEYSLKLGYSSEPSLPGNANGRNLALEDEGI